MQNTKFAIALLTAMLAATTVSFGQTAPDATLPGPFTTTSSEYKLPPTNDDLVAPQVVTELWARIYRPANLNNAPHPLSTKTCCADRFDSLSVSDPSSNQ